MNAGAGGVGSTACADREREIRAAMTAAGLEVEVHTCEPARLGALAREIVGRGVDAVVAAGGDGTVSTIAGALAGSPIPLAVLPLGTLNHFAKDLGLPI